MDKIDVSAELLTIDADKYYANWSVAEVTTTEEETEVEIAVSSFQDAEYIDMTPIFDVLAESAETVGDRFYLKEVQFNPAGAVATLVLTNCDIRSEDTLAQSFEVTRPSGRFYTLDEEILTQIDYNDPPFLVGYRKPEKRLALEL